ncbi:LEF-4 [Parapoynx stagnalis nucleopolyhedrovirus]|uniref:LEF-4 n=1 Tax=Parapoynx stagnalis nucleopolyhedrovirus TaxID=2993413 RepID=A0A9E8C0F5_9ABAC|nr:LEF-4 [Parapoynx stagnalis nucleopolyhedrovirus]
MDNDNGDFIVEKEISYSINFSQDLLYKILDSYIVPNFKDVQEYFDFYDENNTRTRLSTTSVSSIKKHSTKCENFAYWVPNTNVLVPLVWRESKEIKTPHTLLTNNLNKILKVYVYKHDGIEIKFEHVYFSKNYIDTFDSMMADKIVKLLNILENCPSFGDATKNSQLGSDEILAQLRLEYEFDGNEPDANQLNIMCKMIADMESLGDYQNISPCLPYTTLLDKIVPRKFEQEQKIVYGDNREEFDDIEINKWAYKLDGIRGRGIFVRNFCLIQADDTKFYSTKLVNLFKLNNIVSFQCEIMDDNKIYVTDLLQIFKYKYNNRTQYECAIDHPYVLDANVATECINHLNEHVKSITLTDTTPKCTMLFQKFFTPPLVQTSYTTFAIDGYVVLDSMLRYHKFKWIKSVELEYDAHNNAFNSLNGTLKNYFIVSNIKLEHERVYECALTDNIINVLKHRPDRIVPN